MRFKGYLYTVFSGLVLLAAGLLIVLQWARIAQFSLFGYPYDIVSVGDQGVKGGVNTAVLILASIAFGIVSPWLVKLLFRGIGLLRKAGKAEKLAVKAAQKITPRQEQA